MLACEDMCVDASVACEVHFGTRGQIFQLTFQAFKWHRNEAPKYVLQFGPVGTSCIGVPNPS